MKDQITVSEPTNEKKRVILFWFLLVEGLILTIAGIVLGYCFNSYQTASAL